MRLISLYRNLVGHAERARAATPPAFRILLLCLLGCRGLSGADPGAHLSPKSPSEREVRFAGANGLALAGSLLIPAHTPDAKVPGVILVGGSGPVDRDGNAAGLTTDLYKQIARALAHEGIASLRYDKRSIGASAGPKQGESLVEFTRWENFVGDVVAAFAFLQGQLEIDPNRGGMIGHSEGGMLILQAAGEGKGFHPPPAALVLVGTPGRRGEVVVRDQIARNVARNPFTAWWVNKENDRIMAAIVKTGQVPADVPALLAPVYPPHLGKYLQSTLNFEGAAWAARVPCPVLVIAGERDLNHVVAVETARLATR